MKVTIKDIARIAGVSQATVSKILNNYDDVGEETKKRVMDIMEKEGYRPSYSARSLAKRKTNMIGVVFAGKVNADLNHPVFVEVLNAFKKTIGSLGYDLLFFSNEQFLHEKEDYLARCDHYNVDGCLIIAGDQLEQSVHELDQSPIPCVGVDLKLTGPSSSYITTDSNSIASKVIEHLYLKGHRQIGYIGAQENSLVSGSRLEAFQNVMKQYGLTLNEDHLQTGDFFEESGYRAMKKMLRSPNRPTAVFAVSDLMAIGALRAARELGIAVPEQLSIVGCDDILPARYVVPPLTTVKQDKEKMGKLAAHILLDLINQRIQSSAVLVEPELSIRQSTGAMAAELKPF